MSPQCCTDWQYEGGRISFHDSLCNEWIIHTTTVLSDSEFRGIWNKDKRFFVGIYSFIVDVQHNIQKKQHIRFYSMLL